MARALILVAVLFTLAAICFTKNIEEITIQEVISGENGESGFDISEAEIGIPTSEILRAVDDQMPQDLSRAGAAGLFNLTSILSSNNLNSTGMTFVPLLTFLMAVLQNQAG